jgi:hypothetical protein
MSLSSRIQAKSCAFAAIAGIVCTVGQARFTSGASWSSQLNPSSSSLSCMNDCHLYQLLGALMNEAPSIYACADAIKDWVESQIDAWVDAPAVRWQHNAMILVMVYNLI